MRDIDTEFQQNLLNLYKDLQLGNVGWVILQKWAKDNFISVYQDNLIDIHFIDYCAKENKMEEVLKRSDYMNKKAGNELGQFLYNSTELSIKEVENTKYSAKTTISVMVYKGNNK